MGIKDLFKSSDSKKKIAEAPHAENPAQNDILHTLAVAGNQVAEKALARSGGKEKAREMEKLQNTPEMARSSMKDLYTQLCNSERGGYLKFGNSSYYKRVIDSLKAINDGMKQSFSNDIKANRIMLSQMYGNYQELIKACAAYTSRGAWTEKGKAREKIVKQLQTKASTDMVALSSVITDFCSLPAEEQSSRNWNELLDQCRSVKLTTDDFSKLDDEKGAKASEVYVLAKDKEGKGKVKIKGSDGKTSELPDTFYFKPEDEFDMSKKKNADRVVENAFKRFPKLEDDDKKIIRAWAAKTNSKSQDLSDQLKKLSSDGMTAIIFINDHLNSVDSTNTLIKQMHADNDNKVNMTRRNVATSRMAAILGLDDLIARSETAEIFDKATGTTINGNLMAKAKGECTADSYYSKLKKNKPVFYVEANKPTIDISATATGTFQRDMCSLQVLDDICGQVDRHDSNFLISTNNKGELSGLQGIDNDGSFGLNEHAESYKDKMYAKSTYNIKTGEMVLPYMDKKLADRIEALDSEIIKYSMKDLLTEEEINMLLKRFDNVKKAIGTMDDSRKLNDEDWNDDTAQDMIDQAWNSYCQFNDMCNDYKKKKTNEKWEDAQKRIMDDSVTYENYFGRAMIHTTPMSPFTYGQSHMSPQLERRKKKLQ